MDISPANAWDWVKDRFLEQSMLGQGGETAGDDGWAPPDSGIDPPVTADTSGGAGVQPSPSSTENQVGPSAPVSQRNLPGFGVTMLSPQFADKMDDFVAKMQAAGIPLQVTQAYRSPDQQVALKDNPTAITPAKNSLHSTGNAIDINRKGMDPATLARTVQIAASSGLQWGGNFKNPDPVHFYSDPGGDRVEAIARFSRGVQDFKNSTPGH